MFVYVFFTRLPSLDLITLWMVFFHPVKYHSSSLLSPPCSMQKLFLRQLLEATLRPPSSPSTCSHSPSLTASSSTSSPSIVYVWRGTEIPERVWVQARIGNNAPNHRAHTVMHILYTYIDDVPCVSHSSTGHSGRCAT